MDNYYINKKKFDMFLEKHRTKEGQKNTHTLFGGQFGSYHIPDKLYHQFLNLYKKLVFVKNSDLHIIERHDGRDVGPLVIDIDYWSEKEYGERQYRQDHIDKLVKISTKIIKKYMNINEYDNELEVIVMEKDKPSFKDNKYKDGFHILFPLPINIVNRYFLFSKIKRKAEKENIFSDINYSDDGYDVIFDKRVIYSNGLTMYGSRKKDSQMYDLTLMYNFDGEQIELKYDMDEMVYVCSLRIYSKEEEIPMKGKHMEKKKIIAKLEEIKKSENPFKNSYQQPKNSVDDKGNNNIDNKGNNNADDKGNNIRKRIREREPVGKENELNTTKKLLKVLSKTRADNYSDWLNVGWVLHNISSKLLDDYIEFSKQSSKWQPGCCEKIWNTAKSRDDGYTIASLYWWAQNDNPVEYTNIMRENINKLILEAETGTHDDIAKVVLEMYKHIYRCTSIQKNIWYEFKDNRWVNIDSGFSLSMKLSDEVAREYITLASSYFNQSGALNGYDNENMIQKARNALKVVDKLKSVNFRGQVMSACAVRFHEISKNFEELLDSNSNLLGFNNGVFDLEKGCFRPGLPDDYISNSTKYDYVEYKDNDEEIEIVMQYFRTVMIEDDMRKYVLKFISSCLDGHSREQKFILWTGMGCHSKDTEIMLHDGKLKKVQDITCNDKLMGDDGYPRTVKILYTGEQQMIKIHLDDDINFTVNKNHRLALKNKQQFNMVDDIDIYDQNIIWLEWYEYIENVPLKRKMPFMTRAKAQSYIQNELLKKENVIAYNQVIPVMAADYLNLDDDTKKKFVMYSASFNSNIHDIVHREYNVLSVEELDRDRFYGFEIDGNEKYLMGNHIVTYNSNGKSTTVELMEKTMGEYFGVLPTTVLTRKRGNASNATPELADKRGKRVLFIQEPEHDDTIYVGLMKNLTGGDWIEARALYGMPFRYKPQFKLVLVCNKLPYIPANDQGTWRRLRVTPWESKFVDHVPTKNNEFKKDKKLQEKLSKWKEAFMWILLNKYYPDYKQSGLDEPDKVKQFTDKYKNEQDMIAVFINDNMEITGNPRDKVSIVNVYETFKAYYRTNLTHACNINKKEFEDSIANIEKIKILNGMITGIIFKIEDDENDEGDENADVNKYDDSKLKKNIGKTLTK